MPKLKGEYSGNALLGSLTTAELRLLDKHFEWVDLETSEVIPMGSGTARFIYFPMSGVYSVLSRDGDGNNLEVGLIGNEGVVGISVCLFVNEPSFKIVVQTPGRLVRISERNFLRIYNSSLGIKKMILQYIYAFLVQVAQTALANAKMTIEQRLARWLLMCQDRIAAPELAITHQALSNILGVRRSGITVAMQSLEGTKAIKSMRGKVRILDRSRLRQIAGKAYGTAERDYQRIMSRP